MERLVTSVDGTETNADAVRAKLAAAVLPGMAGRASQIAAIFAIAELARAHPDLLFEPGRQALLSLKPSGDETVDGAADAAVGLLEGATLHGN
jgi:hypothetical protein